MTKVEIIKDIAMLLTGGHEVDLEVDNKAIESFINDGFRRVVPWYLEPLRIETVAVLGNDDQRYIPYSNLSKVPRLVNKVFNIVAPTSAGDLESTLLGIEGRIVTIKGLQQWAAYVQYERQYSIFAQEEITFLDLKQSSKILLSGVFGQAVLTVQYHIQPATVEDITKQKALDWIIDWARAKTQIALGRVRGKFRGGDLNFETDADDLISTGSTELERLEDTKTRLDFTIMG